MLHHATVSIVNELGNQTKEKKMIGEKERLVHVGLATKKHLFSHSNCATSIDSPIIKLSGASACPAEIFKMKFSKQVV